MAKTKKVTFKDIAAYTGFSKTTISRYFNNLDSLTVENQDKIKQALDALGYEENKIGRILASGRTEMIGVVFPNLYLHYYAAILDKLLETFDEYGYKFIVFNSNDDMEMEKKRIQEMKSYNIEGLVVLTHNLTSEELAALDIPVVGMEREDEHISSVNCDNYLGGSLAAKTLIEDDCDVLLHINVPVSPQTPSYARLEGFEDTAKKAGKPFELILHDMGPGTDNIKKDLKRIFEQIDQKYPDLKKGVFLSNDTYAALFLNEVVKAYGKLPDTYKIIGFDNSPIAKETIYNLTTIGQNMDEMVREAMDLLVAQIEGRKKRRPVYVPVEHKTIKPSLIQGETA